jgi:WW domain
VSNTFFAAMKFHGRNMLAVCTAPLMCAAVHESGPPTGYGSAASSYGGYGRYPQQQEYQYQLPQPQQQQQQGQWYSQTGEQNGKQQEFVASAASEGDQQQQDDAPVDDDEQPPLPEGWSEHYDPNSGQYYYFNAAEGTTTWDRPLPNPAEAVEEFEAGRPVAPSTSGNDERSSATGFDGALEIEKQQQQQQLQQQQQQQQNHPADETAREELQGWSREQQQQQRPVPPGFGAPQELQAGWSSPNATDDGAPDRQQSSKPVLQLEDEIEMPKEEPSMALRGTAAGWGVLPKAEDDRPPQPAAWGVQRSITELQQMAQKEQQSPPQPRQQPPSYADGRWGMPRTPEVTAPHSTQNLQTTHEQQHPMQGNQPSPQQPQQASGYGYPAHQRVPPPQTLGPPQQVQPQPMPRQYPPPQQQQSPNRQLSPGGPSGATGAPGVGHYGAHYGAQYGQYGQYGAPGSYGGSPYQRQQQQQQYQQQPQQPTTGQLVAQGIEEGSAVVREALGSTWRSLLGFGNRTKEAVESAREQVVSSAAVAGQTLSQRSSSK